MSGRRPTTQPSRRRASEAEDPERDADTAGHSVLACEFGAPIELERRRQAEQAARDLGRLARRQRRGILERIHGQPPRRSEARR